MRLEAVPILIVLLTCSSADVLLDGRQQALDAYLAELTLNQTLSDEKVCYGEGHVEGRCVKTSMCNKEAEPIDPTKIRSMHKEKSSISPDDCGFLKICCTLDKLRTDLVPPPPVQAPGCGYSNPGLSTFRSGSGDSGYADYAEFPWMVALLKNGYKEWTSKNYIGGGSLIHPSVVLTTAHKVVTYEPRDLKVRAGEWDTENRNELFSYLEGFVRDIIIHEQFDRVHAYNNVALLFMVRPFDIQAHINVACLSPSLPAPGTVCYSMGWGLDFTKGKYYANVLKKITLPLMEREECERRFRTSKLGPSYTLHRSLLCAEGQANVDTCLGDGGSPLVCPIGSPTEIRYAVVGMLSYGLECGDASTPGAYASVPEAYEWIGQKLRLEGVDDTSYVY